MSTHAPVPPAPADSSGALPSGTGPSAAPGAFPTAAPGAFPSAAPGAATSGWQGGSRPAPRSGTAVTALVVGLLALLGCLVPVLNLGSVGLGLAAVVLGLVALRRLVPPTTGRGMAIAGIVTGAIGLVVAAAMWVVLVALGASVDEGDLESFAEDLSVGAAASYDCATLGDEAVGVSATEAAAGDPTLLAVTEAVVVEDHRTALTLPTDGEEALVLSCRGTATWSDGTTTPVLTELTIDTDGGLYAAYTQE
ncbi:DUF4190 domain-containing protein [Cellulomonas marina]|uniref:DUF4190 domain-containing protein n=1 Tax=Cellulomonas marina TaxID=988821 RepID=A0A1I1AKW7_9CELL|nr:DUF4190 domain-containing protein [Cellulomonas marina]GIG30809.1 hypothetical protein Cma02nite_34090 [Cellulomonas marina]SFB38654.1 hypothetical protein SAMN05421867_11960 [Cellulomonas marina]